MDAKGLLIKGSIGLVGVGGIGYAGYQAISSKSETKKINNIQKRLKEEGYAPLTKDSVHFTAILSDYKKIIASKQTLKFGDFTGDKPSGETKEPKDILWEYCENTFKEESNTNLNKAKKWFVEPVSVSTLVAKKLSVLDATTTTDNVDQGKWDEKVKKYRTKASNNNLFGTLSIGTGEEAVTPEHRKLVKEKCAEAAKIKSHEDKYEENLKNFKDWCTDK